MATNAKKLKILIFIESDIVIRHFIHSGVFQRICERHHVKFVFPESGYRRITVDVENLNLRAPWAAITIQEERRRLWRRLYLVSILRWRSGRDFAELRKAFWSLLGWKATLQLTFYGLPGIRQIHGRYLRNKIDQAPISDLRNFIKSEEPDLILHPSTFDGYFISDLVSLSKELAIPFILIMNSWDNPSVKWSCSGVPDWVIVWGEQTKRHAARFLNVPTERIIKLGAAQFDVFRLPPRVSREAFCKEHHVDPRKLLLLYAGSSKFTNEFEHLLAIEQAIECGALPQTTVIYRPHPWGEGGSGGNRILERNWKHVVIEASMRVYLEQVRAGETGLYMAEYYRTHDVLSAIDALVSPLSTILLEGALHGKPVLCYLPPEDKGTRSLLGTVRRLTHFEEMFDSPAMMLAANESELVNGIGAILARSRDPSFRDLVREEMKQFVEQPSTPYPDALADVIERIPRY